MANPIPASIAEHFCLCAESPSGLALVLPNGETKACGWVEKLGYAAVKYIRKNYWAHRVCYFMYYKTDPLDAKIDHIDGNKLNNDPLNLRLATESANQANQKLRKQNSSGYKGVSWIANRRKWRAQITKDKRGKHLGCFDAAELAAEAYDRTALELFGEYAMTNRRLGLL